ncbi:MAG: hypothetical protein A4E66_02170 [Syntrophus sp. PtaB.Bin001]|nr:MAG: hypothetical protein A4E66_02170 [Syntrophus sp. PtaB.Bin001]
MEQTDASIEEGANEHNRESLRYGIEIVRFFYGNLC